MTTAEVQASAVQSIAIGVPEATLVIPVARVAGFDDVASVLPELIVSADARRFVPVPKAVLPVDPLITLTVLVDVPPTTYSDKPSKLFGIPFGMRNP